MPQCVRAGAGKGGRKEEARWEAREGERGQQPLHRPRPRAAVRAAPPRTVSMHPPSLSRTVPMPPYRWCRAHTHTRTHSVPMPPYRWCSTREAHGAMARPAGNARRTGEPRPAGVWGRTGPVRDPPARGLLGLTKPGGLIQAGRAFINRAGLY